MGTWGYNYFENDTAADFVLDIKESGDAKHLMEAALEEALETDYLDADLGTQVIVVATYIDAALNKTKFTPAGQDEVEEVDAFAAANPQIDLKDLQANAVTALEKTLGDDSELNELWTENEEDYPQWKASVQELIVRLSGLGRLGS